MPPTTRIRRSFRKAEIVVGSGLEVAEDPARHGDVERLDHLAVDGDDPVGVALPSPPRAKHALRPRDLLGIARVDAVDRLDLGGVDATLPVEAEIAADRGVAPQPFVV